MSLEIWLAFVMATVVFCIIPGPTVILVIGQAIAHGKKSVIPLVAGVLAGDFTAMTLSVIGLGAILAASASLFLVLKWFGVGYLIYLGIKTWRQTPQRFAEADFDGAKTVGREQGRNMFRSAFLVTALNPKDIIFFVAFLPQFIDPNTAVFPQWLILMATLLCLVGINISFYTYFAGTVRQRIQSYQARKRLNRIGGTALVSAGLITASLQRS